MASWAYTGCVYLAMNKVNGSIYIGKTIHGLHWRKKTHEGQAAQGKHQMPFHRALRKHGNEAFDWFELYVSSDDADLCVAEISLIADYKSCGLRMYNATDGGDGTAGRKLSNVSLQRMRSRKVSEEQKEKLRASWTPERRAAQAEKMRNRVVSEAARESSRKQAKRNLSTPEAIEKVRASKTGKKLPAWTEERRAKHAAAWKAKREAGYTINPETIAKIAATKKRNYANDPEARSRLSELGKLGAKARWG